MNRSLCCFVILSAFSPSWLIAQEAEPPAIEATIRATVKSYVAAFNKHDAQALADQWSEGAVYTNRLTGEEVVGRKAIAEQFTAIFKERPELKLDVQVASVDLLSPSVAVEHGTATVTGGKDDEQQFKYSAVYVQSGGKWLLDRVTDEAAEEAPSHYDALKQLEWMVGTWIDADDESVIKIECNWTKNKNFLTRAFTVSVGNEVEMSGMQIIGWDPASKQIRSWTFDSDGGFAEATWKMKKDRWYIHSQGIDPDGKKVSAVQILKPVDEDTFTWQVTDRSLDGELLPNIDEVQIVRE